MSSVFRPNTRKNNIVVQQLADETLVYDLKTNKAYCLNKTSALVWQLCDGKRTVSEISDEMSVRLRTLVSEDFVRLALDQFGRDELLKTAGDGDISFGGLSRREVIRKVGFASVVALPIVSSLVAPEASMAQSCTATIPLHTTCTQACECVSGNCLATPTGSKCCAPGTNPQGFPPGSGFVCVIAGFDCTINQSPSCCSGSASTQGQGPCPTGQSICVCN